MYRSRSDIELFHKSPSTCRKNNTKTTDDNESEYDKENDEENFGIYIIVNKQIKV